MKKINLLQFALILLVFAIFACKKDNKTTISTNQNSFIIGKWSIDTTEHYDIGCTSGSLSTVSITSPYHMEFTTDNKLIFTKNEPIETTKYKYIDNTKILVDFDHDNILDSTEIKHIETNKKLKLINFKYLKDANNVIYKSYVVYSISR